MPQHPPPVVKLTRVAWCVIGLVGLTTWLLSHSYHGVSHDAGLYTLQALSHSRVESLANDVFLKFGSQDRLTLFSPLYALTIEWLGVDQAAALLTVLSQAALLLAAWALASSLMDRDLALIGVAVLIALPGDYGAGRTFSCIEPFITPRMAAEALALGSLAAAMCQRHLRSSVLLIAATLLHPVMAAAGLAALCCLHLALPRPRLTGLLIAAALVAITAQALWMPTGEWGSFDAAWLQLVENRSPYLFLRHWQFDDWAHALVCLGTLCIASRMLSSKLQTLANIAVIVGIAGLALTAIACDGLHLVLFTQLQPWRWQWLDMVAAALLLAPLLLILWSESIAGRATACLVIASWLFGSNAYALASIALAPVALTLSPRLKSSEVRWIMWGAYALVAIALTWRLATIFEFTAAHLLDHRLPMWIRRCMSAVLDGTLPLAIVAIAAWLSRKRYSLALVVVGASAVGLLVAIAPSLGGFWVSHDYSQQQIARFAPFRARIPVGSSVFWPQSPLAVWLLLDRPNYLSVIQTSGFVFSRASALEMQGRADALAPILSPDTFLTWESGGNIELSQQQLRDICRAGVVEYLVSTADLEGTPVASIAAGSGAASRQLRLYRCVGATS